MIHSRFDTSCLIGLEQEPDALLVARAPTFSQSVSSSLQAQIKKWLYMHTSQLIRQISPDTIPRCANKAPPRLNHMQSYRSVIVQDTLWLQQLLPRNCSQVSYVNVHSRAWLLESDVSYSHGRSWGTMRLEATFKTCNQHLGSVKSLGQWLSLNEFLDPLLNEGP